MILILIPGDPEHDRAVVLHGAQEGAIDHSEDDADHGGQRHARPSLKRPAGRSTNAHVRRDETNVRAMARAGRRQLLHVAGRPHDGARRR